MKSENVDKGKFGEEIAKNHLKTMGFKLLESNYRAPVGEVDIIAEKKKELYFIEVKTRWSNLYGNPLESVDLRKQRKIISVVKHYMMRHASLRNVPCHLSVVGVDISGSLPEVTFIADAFEV